MTLLASHFLGKPFQPWVAFCDAAFLMFCGLAGPGEEFQAEWEHIYIPRFLEEWDFNQKDSVIVRVEVPRTKWKGARQQFVILEEKKVVRWFKWRRPGSPPGKLWPFSPTTWGKCLQLILAHLQMPAHVFIPACFRAGGATFDYLFHKSVPRLRLKGRWSSARSLDHYIPEATALLASSSFPPASLPLMRPLSRFASELIRFVVFQHQLPPLLSNLQQNFLEFFKPVLFKNEDRGRRSRSFFPKINSDPAVTLVICKNNLGETFFTSPFEV